MGRVLASQGDGSYSKVRSCFQNLDELLALGKRTRTVHVTLVLLNYCPEFSTYRSYFDV